jgi:hypothetical protein
MAKKIKRYVQARNRWATGELMSDIHEIKGKLTRRKNTYSTTFRKPKTV